MSVPAAWRDPYYEFDVNAYNTVYEVSFICDSHIPECFVQVNFSTNSVPAAAK